MSPTIDLDRPGPPEAAWTAFLEGLSLPELDLSEVGGAVVVAPHPDDEVLGCGGLLSLLSRSGRSVTVLAATDGEAALPGSSRRARLLMAATRRSEQRQALDTLGGSRVELRRLGLRDGGLGESETELAEAIVGAAGSSCAAATSVGRRTLCLAPYRDEGHPDHEAAGRAAARACARTGAHLLEYLVWTWHWAEPADGAGTAGEQGGAVTWSSALLHRLGPEERAAKARAIGVFASQTSAGPAGGPVLPPSFLERFARPFEVFLG